MASNSSNDSYSDPTRCPLCFERCSKEEKRIRIIHDTASGRKHTSCTVCIKRLLKGGNKLECPFCREYILVQLPVEDLPIFEGDDLELSIDEATHLKEVVEAVMNAVCSICDDIACFRCVDCRIYLCEDCKRAHAKAKTSKRHVFQELDKLSEEERANFEEVPLCSDHGLPVEMYCPECEIPCCLKCEEHLPHSYKKLKVVVQEKEKIIKKEGTRALERKPQITRDIGILKIRKEAIARCKNESHQAIKATVSTIIANLKRHEERLMEQVSTGNDKLTRWIDQEIKSRESILDIMGVVEAYFDRRRKIGETKQLELYRNIEQGLERLHLISPDVEPASENEGHYFLANSTRIQDLERMDIGHVFSPTTAQDIDVGSTKGSYTDLRDEIRILAIGKKRSGRSQTLIALMTQDVHINGEVVKGPGYGQWTKTFKGKTFLLSKTPGLDAIKDRDLDMEKRDINKVTCPGPHVLLLIIKNPDEDVGILDQYRDLFQDDLFPFLILVFAGKKDLDKRGVTIQRYVQSRVGELARVVTAVNGRCVAINPDDKESLPSFREALFKMIRDLVHANGLRYVTLK